MLDYLPSHSIKDRLNGSADSTSEPKGVSSMLDARSNTPILMSMGFRKVRFKLPFLRPIFILATAFIFLFSSVGGDLLVGESWAAKAAAGLTSVGPESAGSPTPLKELNADAFTMPQELGYVQEAAKVSDSAKTVIHIQDAHCNYAAQKKISEILDYLTREYGIYAVNCEGGEDNYDLAVFTSIDEKDIREKVSDFFVKEGVVNAAEFFAVNNPEKVKLWGVEDADLYIKNLKVYRESFAYKDEVDGYIKSLGYILDNLKMHIYSPELLDFDNYYTKYKDGEVNFKEYITYLIMTAGKRNINIKSFPNIYLLGQTLSEEDKINFRKADNEKDEVIDKFKKILSKNELGELMAKVGQMKIEHISQADFYAYLVKKAKSIKLDLKNYPELGKYIVYISIYSAIDRTKIMREMDSLEDKIKETLYENDTQRELGILSKNLILEKNIFNISITRDDYTYYKEHRASFDTSNFVRFIDTYAPLYKIQAGLERDIGRLDIYRERMEVFYECSLERDKAFVKNIKFTDHDRPNSIIITGGFHTQNLRELFGKEKVSYISIMPKFTDEKGYKSPYLKRLAGQRTALENVIDTAIPAVLNLQVVNILSQLAPEVEGKANIERFRLAVLIMVYIEKGQKFILKLKGGAIQGREKETEKFITFARGEGAEGVISSSEQTTSADFNAELINVTRDSFVYIVNIPQAPMAPVTQAATVAVPAVRESYPTLFSNLVSNGKPVTGIAGLVEKGNEITITTPGAAAGTPGFSVHVATDKSGKILTENREHLITALESEANRPSGEITPAEREQIKGLAARLSSIEEIIILEPQDTIKGFFWGNKLYLSKALIEQPLGMVRLQEAAVAVSRAQPMYESAKNIIPEMAQSLRRKAPTYLLSPALSVEDIAPEASNNKAAEHILNKQDHEIHARSYLANGENWDNDLDNLRKLLENTMKNFVPDARSNKLTRMAIRLISDKEGNRINQVKGIIKALIEEYKEEYRLSDVDIDNIIENQIRFIPISIPNVQRINASIDLFTDIGMMEIDRYLQHDYEGEMPVQLRDRFLALLKSSITNFDDIMKLVKTEEDIAGILNAIFKCNIVLQIRPVDWKSIDAWKKAQNEILTSL